MNPTTDLNARPVSIENNSSGVNPIGVQSHVPSFPGKSWNALERTSSNGNLAESITGDPLNHSLHKSDLHMVPETEHFQEDVPSAPRPSSSIHTNPSLDGNNSVSNDGTCRMGGPELSKKIDNIKQLNHLENTENCPAHNGPDSPADATRVKVNDSDLHCNSSDTLISSENAKLVAEESCKVAEDTLMKDRYIRAAPKFSCLYSCCPGCLHALYLLVHDFLCQSWESNGRISNVEDIDNFVSSCSLNLLAAVRKCVKSQGGNNSTGYCPRSGPENCACKDVDTNRFKKMSYLNKTSENMFLTREDCSCHSRSEGSTAAYTESDSPSGQVLKYVFRDGVLVSSETQEDDALHCRSVKLCLCSLVEMILSLRKPLE